MNELKKTGIFWAVTAVMLLIATVIAWPTSDDTDENSLNSLIGQPLIPGFKDPMSVASMKIVSFDEAQGTLSNFEVAKDSESGDWTIVSRKGYPADAVEQVTNAANSLIALKVLDVVPCTREEHDDLGVVEPKLESLNVGDEGVGRLVTFRDADKKVVASLIIGDRTKDADDHVNVRIPGQDPVYIVKLDDAPLTTKFQDWIERDLLKLSSIDIDEMQVQDYSATLNRGGQISLQKNYTADFVKDGSTWSLAKLQEYDPKRHNAPPKVVEVKDDQKLNTTKLNDVQNGLDDLKIVNVLRKPDGMSASLRASEDFLSDDKAVRSLANNGFYPVPSPADGEIEILSANGEMTVGLKDGVQYVLRFGNIAAATENDDPDDEQDGEDKTPSVGVNRYLLVTTRVDESKFPAPDLKEVPQTLQDLDKMDAEEAKKNAPKEDPADESASQRANDPDPSADGEEKTSEETSDAKQEAMKDGDVAEEKAGEEKAGDKKADQTPSSDPPEKKADKKAAGDEEGQTQSEGSESATATGQAFQEASDDGDNQNADDETAEKKKPADKKSDKSADKKADKKAHEKADNGADNEMKDKPATDQEPDETVEEKQERLEATQEKITKENQRMVDERKDRLAKAKNRVRELNARFADWYYVIPEETFAKLTIKRADLFQKPGGDNPGANGPQMQMPAGFPAGLQGLNPGN